MSKSSYTPSDSPSPNIKTTLALINAYNEWDASKLSAVLDDSLEFQILPKSLGRPVSTKAEYLDNFEKNVQPMFKRFHLTIHDLVETDSAVASSEGESVTGAPYANEYVIFLYFVPPKEGGDGLPKISMVKEFVDSARSVKFFTEERARGVAAKGTETVSE
ncbi:hypothetical protein H0H81_007231 [Sphagnurus paluster]|uniref:SnoaL-like domain-containing protein n=1 Tax=Sphagnurus paluster TaxID=117069 RepID=A0A9P7FQW2_9AGAR|nr:hypothetical protein H0H81_007231 [Sphagnurus paluster]